MTLSIKKAAVLGGGVMGSAIAAHLAGAGVEVFLLDIVPKELTPEEEKKGLTLKDPAVRNRFALQGVKTALAARPAAFFDPDDAALIRCGNYEDNSNWIGEADWICEAVVENLKVKRAVFENVARHRRPGSIVTSNTSGLSLREMTEGMPEEMKRHFFVTHFFNPVRYMHLLEIVPCKETDMEVVEEFARWAERKLGKGIVYCKDTPNFVANRIGVYSIMSIMKHMDAFGLSVEDVDAIMGPPSGRPKSAAFRTLDMVGIDTFVHVARNVYERALDDEEREVFNPPKIFLDMVERKWLGEKSDKTGFYKVVQKEGGEKEILKLDLKTMTHLPQEKKKFKSIGKVRDIEDPAKRIKTLVGGDDEAAKFAWRFFSDLLCYSTRRIPEIADDVVNIDNAMKWGFGWELGPFETLDGLGVREFAERLRAEGRGVPPLIEEVLEKGEGSFYKWEEGRKLYWDTAQKRYLPVKMPPGILLLRSFKERKKVIHKTGSASLIDLDDGVLLLEFHSKMNTIDTDMNDTAEKAFELLENGWQGLVIGNEDPQAFSAGANLMLVMMCIGQKDWKQLEMLVKSFQNLNMRFKYSRKPVVAAPFGLTLGGGCEMVMHADAVQAAAELYMGLVEVGVGLIPAGGGTKEMLFRMHQRCEREGPRGFLPPIAAAFENIALAKVTTGAKEAFKWHYLDPESDGISWSRDFLIADAKKKVIELARGYIPRFPRTIRLPGEGGRLALEYGVEQLYRKRQVTQYETKMASKLAWVLTGGDIRQFDEVTEERLLELECEAFLSLAGEPKTAERISHMLSTGKPLRN